MLRGAEFVDAATDKTFVTVNPTSEEPIATFQAATEADVNIAVAAGILLYKLQERSIA